MKNVRLLCLVVLALVVGAVAPPALEAESVCCMPFAELCVQQCSDHGGVFLLDCPFPAEVCVCNDWETPGGGPDCPWMY